MIDDEVIFPYFGTKRKFADQVWRRFGNPERYIEPFAGSIAVLLRRPELPAGEYAEVIGDLSGKIANTWRAIQADPEAVARHCTWPTIQQDQIARSREMRRWFSKNEEKIKNDPDFFDAKIAGWYVWGQSSTAGAVYGDSDYHGPTLFQGGVNLRKTKYSHISFEKCIKLNIDILKRISDRIHAIHVHCKPWEKCLSSNLLTNRGNIADAAIFLDPPYKLKQRANKIYENEEQSDDAAVASYEWAIANGEKYKVAYCCHSNDFPLPAGWDCEEREFIMEDRKNRGEVKDWVMFSPACLKPGKEISLFD